MKASIEIIKNIKENWKLSMTLARNDFKTKFAGSYLGIVWSFIQPIVTILVYWFVFQVGLRDTSVAKTEAYPYVLYLISGIVPWFFFADALSGGATGFLDYSYLVKQVVFNISIIPFIKVVSAIFVHLFFVLFTVILFVANGFYPDIYYIQILYYMLCTFILSLGLAYLFSSIVVFFRDMKQIINIIIIQTGVWITPIMWNAENTLSPLLLKIFKLNPVYYIVDGYRDAFLFHRFFWQGKGMWTLYFWVITILIFMFGSGVYKRSRPHFADLL